MKNSNTIGVDLAKNVIQVSVVSKNNKELQNKELTCKTFAEFLAKQQSSLVAFESCATAHYWSRVAIRMCQLMIEMGSLFLIMNSINVFHGEQLNNIHFLAILQYLKFTSRVFIVSASGKFCQKPISVL